MVDIGKEIRTELRQQGRTVTWLAQQLDMRRATLYDVFRKNSIDTYLLKRIGLLLGKDFFILLSTDMQNDDCASSCK
ncbi:MAG: XRE family transcriptional regulator [Bacteroidales bacterium]|nr:XRE family transcriptional regulator [Bacteroidales bacterium]